MVDQHNKNASVERYVITAAILLIIATGVIFTQIRDSRSDTGVIDRSGTNFTATVDPNDIEVLNPATIQVTVAIHNNGDKPGKPSCTVEAGDGTREYHGVDYIRLQDEIDPGESKATTTNVTITNQGAGYVKAAVAKCQ